MTSSPSDTATATLWCVVGALPDGSVGMVDLAADGSRFPLRAMTRKALVAEVARREAEGGPRWVWSHTPHWYAPVLRSGTRVARCHDLRLSHAILRDSALARQKEDLQAATEWDAGHTTADALPAREALFDVDDDRRRGVPDPLESALEEFDRQRAVLSTADGRLRLLVAAESAGALVAVEMQAAGLPWSTTEHDRILTEALGPRPVAGGVPEGLDASARRVRDALGDDTVSLESQPKLLRALHRAGVLVESTSRWELAEHDHPVVAPLLEYKKLTRLLSANGWSWMDEWIHDERFRPEYVPGGVVTGRWASSGGGALQIPRRLRSAVRADPGWTLIVADVAQLEPRVLAAMAGDQAMAAAGRGRDLYSGIVESGAVSTRQEAKIAVLGAMYGATTGDSGRLVPRLRRTYPDAMRLVDEAAAVGERGGIVSTALGRTSPAASGAWRDAQGRASDAEATLPDERRARQSARDRGRFTRNFVVQGTAAEWALAWLADIRLRLAVLPLVDSTAAAPRSGPAFDRSPHLAFFLHDEVIVHTPVERADAAADAIRLAAASAGRLLFGAFPIDFPLDLKITDSAEKS